MAFLSAAAYGAEEACAAALGTDTCAAASDLREPPTFLDLILGGNDAANFFATVWQQEPLLRRSLSVRPRVSFRDVEAAMEAARRRGTFQGRVTKEGVPLLHDAQMTERRVAQALREGATLSLRSSVGLLNDELARAARALEMAIGINVEVNLYQSDGASAPANGFHPHWDSQDVFVLQLQGSKSWRVYGDAGIQLPLESAKPAAWTAALPPSVGAPVLDAVLAEGDMLYVPRGRYHLVRPQPGESSLHVTLTVLTGGFAFADMLRFAVDASSAVAPAVTQLPAAVRFKEALAAPVAPGARVSRSALFAAVLDDVAAADVAFRRAAVTPGAATASLVQQLAAKWVDGVATTRRLRGASAEGVAELQGALRSALAAATADGPKRLLQELELRYFQGLRHFGFPQFPADCLAPAPAGRPPTTLRRNQHAPGALIWLYESAEVGLFAQDFVMGAYSADQATALEQVLAGNASLVPTRDLPAAMVADLVQRGLCCVVE